MAASRANVATVRDIEDDPLDAGSFAARVLFESIEARAAADADRVSTLLREVKDRIGEAPLCIDDGRAFVHPELQRELSKPGNEDLNEMLVSMARNHPKPRTAGDVDPAS